MSYISAAIVLVLAALQAPRPAATASTVASEDETLRGLSAMSVSVQVEGTLIDATATKADIETKLRQRGVGVLSRGLPRLHLQVDYLPTSSGRRVYAVFAMRLELAQALTRPGAAGLVEGLTWRNGAFGILGDEVTEKLDARVSSLLGEFLGALLSVNAGLAKAAGAAGLGVKQTIHTMHNRAYLASFFDLPRDREDVVLKQLEQVIAQRQQLLICTYGPMNKAQGTGFVTHEFWYRAAPAGIREMLAVAPRGTHPFRYLGVEGLETCPETPEIATRLREKMSPQHEK
jgi:hypothetical protein